ncbi:MAG TPA: hypothetical protein VK882_01890 [Nitrososphaeraceae archaeon]|nr:hypothetical protein [Nitrososphaeraceae archaeon]
MFLYTLFYKCYRCDVDNLSKVGETIRRPSIQVAEGQETHL